MDQKEQLLQASLQTAKSVIPILPRLADNKPTYKLAVYCMDVLFDLLNGDVPAAQRHFTVFAREFIDFLQKGE